MGFRVGILDADIYGPSQPKMFGVEGYLPDAVQEEGADHIVPAEPMDIRLMSIGFFIKPTDALLWRGAMAVSSVNTSKPVTTTMNTIVSGQPTAEPARTTDVRKPRSFAEVIANESNTTRKPDSNVAKVTTVQPKTVTQERDEALAMFGKPRPYATDSTATKQDVAATTSTVSNKRYMMQCGAFRTADQASSLQSRIAVQGQSARISEGSNTSGTWHRVVLGPYANRPAAEQALSRLKGAGTVQSCTIYSK
jgi:cell division protein FtsN